MARSAGFEPATLCLEAGFRTLLSSTKQYYYLRYTMVFKNFLISKIDNNKITYEIFCYLFATF